MIYKAVTVWLAFQLPLGLILGLVLRRAEMPNMKNQEDEADVPSVVLSEKACEVSAPTGTNCTTVRVGEVF